MRSMICAHLAHLARARAPGFAPQKRSCCTLGAPKKHEASTLPSQASLAWSQAAAAEWGAEQQGPGVAGHIVVVGTCGSCGRVPPLWLPVLLRLLLLLLLHVQRQLVQAVCAERGGCCRRWCASGTEVLLQVMLGERRRQRHRLAVGVAVAACGCNPRNHRGRRLWAGPPTTLALGQT
eukprot:1141527-Pelagomonas_calceolata.AAC.4